MNKVLYEYVRLRLTFKTYTYKIGGIHEKRLESYGYVRDGTEWLDQSR